MRSAITIIIITICNFCSGQENNILAFDTFMSIVKNEHPVMYQSRLLSKMAESTQQIAKGGFDPKMEVEWNSKSFKDKNYYSILSSAIKVPTWYGIDIKAGYDRNNGQFLNESDILPTRGLWSAGISVPIGKGLVIDLRRAELQKAEIYNSVTEQQQLLMINELLYNACLTYIDWQSAFAKANIAKEGQVLAEKRFNGTLQSFINGDKPAIDTLESYIILQSRELDYQKATQKLENTEISLNNYLWIDGYTPMELMDNSVPSTIDIGLLADESDAAVIKQNEWIASHPELLLYEYKIAGMNVDLRLAKEDLKPDLRVNYNPILGVADDSLFDEFNANDYKLGATLSYPILQRKQRGKIQLNHIKVQDTEYQRTLKYQELEVKLDTYANNITQTLNQYNLLTTITGNYQKMLSAENRKLSIGESSIFLVNSRERKYLESRYKMISAGQKLLFNRLTYLLYSSRLTLVL